MIYEKNIERKSKIIIENKFSKKGNIMIYYYYL